jgi:RES domain-containing protein
MPRKAEALACLETVVHLNAGGLPFNRYLVAVTIPDDVWSAAQVENASGMPVGWDAAPAGRVSIAFGSEWIRSVRSALLCVPSVIVPEETNILINPAHPASARITATKLCRWLYDPRLAAAP